MKKSFYCRSGMNCMDSLDLVNAFDCLFREFGCGRIVKVEALARRLGYYPYEMYITVSEARSLVSDLKDIGCHISFNSDTDSVVLEDSGVDFNYSTTVARLHLIPVLVYNILLDKEVWRQNQLIDELEQSYNIKLERQTLGRHLKTMHNGLFGVFVTPKGTYYNPKAVGREEGLPSFYISGSRKSFAYSNAA